MHTSRESFCYILVCFIHHHVHSFIIISGHLSVLILLATICLSAAGWLSGYAAIFGSKLLSFSAVFHLAEHVLGVSFFILIFS